MPWYERSGVDQDGKVSTEKKRKFLKISKSSNPKFSKNPKFPGLRATEIANSQPFIEKNKFEDRSFLGGWKSWILKSKIFKILISWKFFSTLTFLSCAFLSLPDCSRSPWGMLIEFCAAVWTFGRRPRRKSQHWEETENFENLEILKSKIFKILRSWKSSKSKICRSPNHWLC